MHCSDITNLADYHKPKYNQQLNWQSRWTLVWPAKPQNIHLLTVHINV